MTPHAFIQKWKLVTLTERAAAQEHFIDLCRLLGHPTPAEDDPTGERFAFEKGVTKTGGGDGFADVWKQGHFAWEYKKKKRDLNLALDQLVRYASALENPPLQVACDTDRFLIRTAWTNAVPKTYELSLDDLADPKKLDILHAVFFDPQKLRPTETRAAVTKEAADKFSTIALRLQGRDTPENVAHFVNQLVFCFFAHSVKLLPNGFFPKLLKRCAEKPENSKRYFDGLFAAMEEGGEYDLTDIAHFNGGLFDGRRALRLESGEIGLLQAAGSLDWSQIDPTIFGTLFERFLDPGKRGQIGAHYTDPDKIMLIIEPVILRPLREEWAAAKAEIERFLHGETKPPPRAKTRRRMTPLEAAEEVRSRFLEHLRGVTILDPACGSGNFLYLALQGVKDIENRANLECEALGLAPQAPTIGPEIVHGIEINPLAAELARTTIWIGDIQWRLRNGIHSKPQPILRKLDSIECRDALIRRVDAEATVASSQGQPAHDEKETAGQRLSVPSPLVGEGREGGTARAQRTGEKASSQASDGARHPDPLPAGGEREAGARYVEAEWPAAEFIVGNPPFLGGKLLRRGLGDTYVETLFDVYAGRVPPEADLVTYWFEKAHAKLKSGRTKRAGLVATNSIRGGANRRLLDRIVEDTRIFEAWSDEPWIVEGAAVRVSLVCFGADEDPCRLDGHSVRSINTDLSPAASDLTKARRLTENLHIAFMGDTKGGAFDIPGKLARAWLSEPINPNGRPNADVLRPWVNGLDVTRRPREMWIIDFGWEMSEKDASLFEVPYSYIQERVLPKRSENRRESYRLRWWRHVEPRPAMWRAFATNSQYLATPTVAKHRLFVRMKTQVSPDHQLIAIARDDDTTFGILHSRFHEAWSLRLCTWLGVGNDPRYTPTTTFETFPFPEGLTPNIPAEHYADDPRAIAIASAAKRLDDLRNAWLNPPDLVRIEPEVYPTAEQLAAGAKKIYPDRILPKDANAAAILRERTLTNLYNQRPQWLVDAHRDLDAAVAAAYGWPADISEEDALAKLLGLNLARAAAGKPVVPAHEEDRPEEELENNKEDSGER